MNAFSEARKIEAQGMGDIISFIKGRAYEGRFVLTDKGTASKQLQKSVGDILFNCKEGKAWGVEVKTEFENRYGNFFLETWSNRQRFTPGWIFTLQTDILLYQFLTEREFYSIAFNNLRSWAFIKNGKNGRPGCIWDYPEKKQSKYDQLNDTWGRCVPIGTIGAEVGFKKYSSEEV